MSALTVHARPDRARSPTYTAAASVAESRLEEIEAELAKALGGGGPKYVERHHARGELTAAANASTCWSTPTRRSWS